MSGLTSSFFYLTFTATLLYVAYFLPRQEPKETSLVLYVHDHLTGDNKSAITVAGNNGPEIESKAIGRVQGMYLNSKQDGKGLYLAFSVIFTDGEFKGSSLEIQGSDIYSPKERGFGVGSGMGYFRFAKGYGLMKTEFMDLPNLIAVIKLSITVKHY
ncbi:dirigent protein 11-like [Tripterygium wilfordii]|uniref:Dirigent protein n=1 Tax=Tripterygium wilfordii TaxID=458696 RepID=A0A7J7E0R2_TRIWF|nr:pterocarpan synthase 1-like [Tripterygium wilfordii]KAF5752133.1 dirigent protein 11-like [Tripterygium wilfordii]